MDATPAANNLPLKIADFATLAEALDYAALGETGYNFYNGSAKLYAKLSYKELRAEARALARRLIGLGVNRGARVAVVADTQPDFMRFFYACQYAGLVPVPLPASIHLGGKDAYVAQLERLLTICQADIAMAPEDFLPYLNDAAANLNLRFLGSPAAFDELSPSEAALRPSEPDDVAYLQYTSGSTRFPRGVMITQKAVLSNLFAILKYGIQIRSGDRAVSWLPYFHDMGLVGLVLSPMAAQVTVDYLNTRDFAMRPRLWLTLMSQNRATLSFSPPFGYELAARRVREKEVANFDLSNWRIAGIGAETIRTQSLEMFADLLAPAGFDRRSYVPCYGMAECSLAVSFAPLGQGVDVDHVDGNALAEEQLALPLHPSRDSETAFANTFTNCGAPLPGFETEVRDDAGKVLPERHCGTLFVRGPSIMSGYFGDLKATREVLSPDGWLNTGDLAYRVGNSIVITGREKDLIIINGRNVWPQDLEYLAEQQPEVRTGDASAFSIPGPDGNEQAVMMVQCRETDDAKRADLQERLHSQVRQEYGIDCLIELVPRNTLPRTTSGKLSRSGARKEYLKRVAEKLDISRGDPYAAPLRQRAV
ncbi:MAG: fatty acyl-AMP ligase [Deltaproteobacteria bacterium]|jgi:fatty-acyl-CoA synthase|nr:fatty acyl-AMP ligase [Deltaproteobacteria bacterium]